MSRWGRGMCDPSVQGNRFQISDPPSGSSFMKPLCLSLICAKEESAAGVCFVPTQMIVDFQTLSSTIG